MRASAALTHPPPRAGGSSRIFVLLLLVVTAASNLGGDLGEVSAHLVCPYRAPACARLVWYPWQPQHELGFTPNDIVRLDLWKKANPVRESRFYSSMSLAVGVPRPPRPVSCPHLGSPYCIPRVA